ncbi:MAG TPA: hypothetical protein VHW06_15835, partial [Streptosporangiaceae bacterium]|nr:hypothetical protein [Streptosporangiaceae bacterium]
DVKTAQLVNCAHLHSAFGPGCPYCWRPAARGVRDDWTRRSPRAPAADAPDRPGEGRRPR